MLALLINGECMSRTGRLLCSAYAVFILGSTCFALMIENGSVARYLLLQLPIALQTAAAYSLGLAQLVEDLSWPAAYGMFALPTFFGLYLAGWVIDERRQLMEAVR
jgi:hypothetical protein